MERIPADYDKTTVEISLRRRKALSTSASNPVHTHAYADLRPSWCSRVELSIDNRARGTPRPVYVAVSRRVFDLDHHLHTFATSGRLAPRTWTYSTAWPSTAPAFTRGPLI